MSTVCYHMTSGVRWCVAQSPIGIAARQDVGGFIGYRAWVWGGVER